MERQNDWSERETNRNRENEGQWRKWRVEKGSRERER